MKIQPPEIEQALILFYPFDPSNLYEPSGPIRCLPNPLRPLQIHLKHEESSDYNKSSKNNGN